MAPFSGRVAMPLFEHFLFSVHKSSLDWDIFQDHNNTQPVLSHYQENKAFLPLLDQGNE